MLEFLTDRHPYIVARERFLAGRITRDQCAGMMATDREFIAEAELRGNKPVAAARAVVEQLLVPELVRNMTAPVEA